MTARVVVVSLEELVEIVREAVRVEVAAQIAKPAPSEWLTSEQAAELAGCGVRTLVRRGCPSHGSARLRRYRRVEVEQWLAGRR